MIKTRFSPSPSGYLHIGGARTALFNWLYAKKNNGVFLVRVEDTDADRSSAESENAILDGLRWLGLDWQEGIGVPNCVSGPYRQSERKLIYKELAEKLIKEGKAYRCYCTQEELDAQRKLIVEKNPKAKFKYPGTCRDRKDEPNKPYVIRFKAPTDGFVEYDDLIFGKIKTPNLENQDFVIMRSDGNAMYNFGACIDDRLMGITNIIRGREHMINTPLQILLYQAFGWNHPKMAHLPLMLAQSGEKLSKRHGSVSVLEYRDNGYTPNSVLNYLAKFGWGHKDQELFSINDLVEKFSLEACKKSDGKFDPNKFLMINYEHLKSTGFTPDKNYAKFLQPFLKKKSVDLPLDLIEKFVPAVREKYKTLAESADYLHPLLTSSVSIPQELSEKFLTAENKNKLVQLSKCLSTVDNWSSDTDIKTPITNWLAENNLALKDISQPLRVALSGKMVGLELFKMMYVLGKEKTLQRLSNGVMG